VEENPATEIGGDATTERTRFKAACWAGQTTQWRASRMFSTSWRAQRDPGESYSDVILRLEAARQESLKS
jgi:hypothetical protein